MLSSTPDQQLENHSTKYHRQQPLYHTLELLMMDILVPETCWASNNICNKNLCCIWLAFYFHILTMIHGQNHIKFVLLFRLWWKFYFLGRSTVSQRSGNWQSKNTTIVVVFDCHFPDLWSTVVLIFTTGMTVLEILGRFSKILQISNFIKVHPLEAELFYVEGRTDMEERIVTFTRTIYLETPKMAIYRQQV